MNVGVILVAAGHGARLGAGRPKALVPLKGQTLLARAARTAGSCPGVAAMVVVAPATHLAEAEHELSGWQPAQRPAITVVPGGAERTDSVGAGLAALPTDVGIVLVHDAARALAPPEVFHRVVAAVRGGHPAVTPAVPVTDTVKSVELDATGDVVVRSTLDRTMLRAVQTPQGFLRETLQRAHDAHDEAASGGSGPATDDAGLVERAGGTVHVVAGDPRSLKITTAHDLLVAETWLSPA